ncbi:BON domain-containing protein [Cupriavidus necator]
MRYSDDDDARRRGDDDYLRRRPDRQYGGNDQGYSGIPAQAHNRRQRDLTAGRYGNTAERLPREQSREVEPGAQGWYGFYAEEWRYPAGGARDEQFEEEWSRRGRGMTDPGARYGPGYGDWPDVPRGEYSEYGEYGGYAPGERGVPSTRWEGQRRPGPKNYRRDDDRVHDEVCNRLAREDELDVSEVSVRVQDGVVTLEGHVTDRDTKYEIEDIAEHVFGVQDVINHIRVQRYGMLASE